MHNYVVQKAVVQLVCYAGELSSGEIGLFAAHRNLAISVVLRKAATGIFHGRDKLSEITIRGQVKRSETGLLRPVASGRSAGVVRLVFRGPRFSRQMARRPRGDEQTLREALNPEPDLSPRTSTMVTTILSPMMILSRLSERTACTSRSETASTLQSATQLQRSGCRKGRMTNVE